MYCSTANRGILCSVATLDVNNRLTSSVHFSHRSSVATGRLPPLCSASVPTASTTGLHRSHRSTFTCDIVFDLLQLRDYQHPCAWSVRGFQERDILLVAVVAVLHDASVHLPNVGPEGLA